MMPELWITNKQKILLTCFKIEEMKVEKPANVKFSLKNQIINNFAIV